MFLFLDLFNPDLAILLLSIGKEQQKINLNLLEFVPHQKINNTKSLPTFTFQKTFIQFVYIVFFTLQYVLIILLQSSIDYLVSFFTPIYGHT